MTSRDGPGRESTTTGEDALPEAPVEPAPPEPEQPPPAEEPLTVHASRELGQPGQPGYHLMEQDLRVDTAQEPAGPCRMCSLPIEVGEPYVIINLGRRVHYVDCIDQARAAGYLGRIEA